MRIPITVGFLVLFGLVPTASATESTISPGVGIGKVKLGMSLAQVKHVFGANYLVDTRGKVAGTPYMELGWDFSSWSVGFLQHGRNYRVAQVSTTLRAQRTGGGLGVGSPFKSIVRAYPKATCGAYYVTLGSTVTTGMGGAKFRNSFYALAATTKNGTRLLFFVKPVNGTPTTFDPTGPWAVFQVVVRDAIRGEIDAPPNAECRYGWELRGTPYSHI